MLSSMSKDWKRKQEEDMEPREKGCNTSNCWIWAQDKEKSKKIRKELFKENQQKLYERWFIIMVYHLTQEWSLLFLYYEQILFWKNKNKEKLYVSMYACIWFATQK